MAYTTLIQAHELQALQGSSSALMVFDCSFDLTQPNAGFEQYLGTHIPHAIYVNLDKNLSQKDPHMVQMSGGRHPLPSRAHFAAWLTSIGFSNQMQAVVYDRNQHMFAGRLWWMLKWLGHEQVAVLDGGLAAWQHLRASTQAGDDTLTRVNQKTQTSDSSGFQIKQPLVQLVRAAQVLSCIDHNDSAIIDARAQARYTGEQEPLDPVAGHIPSALNRPFTDNLAADGRFKSSDVLRDEFLQLLGSAKPMQTVHHCGSGVSAIPNLLAMEVAGLGRTTLYAGSWSDWCSDATRPVARA